MLNNKKGMQTIIEPGNSYKADTTIIGSGANFNGTLNCSGTIRIDGIFEGELNIDGNIIVGESGRIKGNIRAGKITIAGTVDGDVHCSGTLELMSGGKLYGDMEVKGINIEDGAIFDGKCTMLKQPAEQEEEITHEKKDQKEDSGTGGTANQQV